VIDWLYTLPEPVLLYLPAAVLVLLLVYLPRLIQRVPWFAPSDAQFAPSDAHTDFVMRTQATLFTMTSVLLVFTLIQADINFREADSLVSAEAARIDQLDRLLTRYGDEAAHAVRPLLRTYALSIPHDEWPKMLKGRGSDATSRAFTQISRRILAMQPATTRQTLIMGEMLKSLDSVAEARAHRLNLIGLGLPTLYWEVVLFALAMLVGVSCMVQQTVFRSVVLAAQAAAIGAFVGFVFIMDQPFKGDTGISPSPFIDTVARMERRTE
jgi:hypothetical protein